MMSELHLPPGFRFHPTDEELVVHYLCRKCSALPVSVPIIADIDLYKYDPWQLPGMALYGEKEWYFFSPRDRKYPNGSRPNRAAGTGYWKATGADKAIGRPKTLGIKKALVFYSGKAPKGLKTNWIMHEYRLANVDRSAGKNKTSRLDDWVLCRIYNKKGGAGGDSQPTFDRKNVGLLVEDDRKPDASVLDQISGFSPPGFDSSGSDLVSASPWDKEVQSEPRWNDFNNAYGFSVNYIDALLNDDFAPAAEDAFMYLQKSL